MNRRDLLKALPALVGVPVMMEGKEVGKAFKIEPNARYVVFLNEQLCDVHDFCETCTSLPTGTAVHAVYPNSAQTMDDIVRIYKTT